MSDKTKQRSRMALKLAQECVKIETASGNENALSESQYRSYSTAWNAGVKLIGAVRFYELCNKVKADEV